MSPADSVLQLTRRTRSNDFAVINDEYRRRVRRPSSRYLGCEQKCCAARHEFSDHDHMSRRLRRSSPVVGSSKKSTRGSATRLSAEGRAVAACPPEYPFAGRSAASMRSNAQGVSCDRTFGSRHQVIEPAHDLEVFASAEFFLDCSSFGRKTDHVRAPQRVMCDVHVPRRGHDQIGPEQRRGGTWTAVVLPAPFGPSIPGLFLVRR